MSNIKNYVIGTHRRILDSKWNWKDTATEGDIYETYKRMYQYSRASLRHFLQDEWTEICYTEEIQHVNQAARISWQNIYELWHKEPCNILVVGPDVSMIRPTKIFGVFNEFRLFNWTDPKSYTDENPWGVRHNDYFNGDLIYLPHTMKKEVWDIYEQMMPNYRDTAWGDDQIITNQMFWSQNIPWQEAHRPDLFYMAHWLPWKSVREMDEWNCYKMNQAHTIHWSGSRHSPTRLALMKNIHEVLNIPEYNGVLI
jgi:hypothetical protein